MMRRRPVVVRGGRPGLLGTAARTAVVAGTFRMTSNAVDNRAERRADEQPAGQNPQQVPQQQVPQQAEMPQQADLTSQLERLGSLRDSGVLSPEEFDAAKSKLLAG
jgi:hypothetical protein